jgi:hypothetical protein
MARATRFKRAGASRTSELDDSKGLVKITVRLTQEGGRNVVGNITRTLSVADSSVTEVATAIDAALFDAKR